MTLYHYAIDQPITLPEKADPRKADLNLSEVRKKGCRVIGGDKGDVSFMGYTIDENAGTTTLYKPILYTTLELNKEEAFDVALEVVMSSYNAIGIETVEHS